MMHGLPLNLLAHAVVFTAQTFIAGLWQGLALIAAVAIALRVLPRLSASARFVIWTATFTLAATLPLLHTHGAVTHVHAALHVSPWIALGIAALWAALAALRVAQLASQAIRLRAIWRRAVPVEASEDVRSFLATAERRAELCTSNDVDAPSVIGFFAPRLLVPAALLPELTQGELRQIILHECEHLRRRDDWINLAQKLALALFPLNPALLWVDRRLGLERELACDAGVVARLASPFDYAHCLTRLAEHRLRSRRVALALSAWSRRSELAQRVHLLLAPVRGLSPMQMRASFAVLSVGLIAGSLEMARAPRLVAFTDVAPIAVAANTPSLPTPRVLPASYSPSEPVKALVATAVVPAKSLTRRVMASHAALALASPLPTPPVELASAQDKQAQNPEASATSEPVMQMAVATANDRSHAVLASAPQSKNGRSRARFANAMADDTQDVYFLNDNSARARYAAVRFGDGWLIIQL